LVKGDTLGSDNGALSDETYSANPFRFVAPESILPLRWHRLTPYPALCASLRAY